MDAINHLWQSIQNTLEEMGAEGVASERAYGLRCYPELHAELFPDCLRKIAYEERITDGLARGLHKRGILADTEQRYPGTRERCDLIVPIESTGSIWVEVKAAYSEDLNGCLEGTNPKRLFGKRSWLAGVGDIGLKDILKLNRLTRSHATYVGILLFGFDRVDSPLTSEDLYSTLPAELSTWTSLHGSREGIIRPDHYSNRAEKGYRNRLWFWCREVR